MGKPKWLDTAIDILSYLRPKFYNRITWWIVGVGLALIGATPLLERLLIAIFNKQFSLEIPCDVNNTIGIILISLGLIYNILMKVVENSHEVGSSSKSNTVVQSDIKAYEKIMTFLPYEEVESFAKYDFMGSFRWDNYDNISLYLQNIRSPQFSFSNEELNGLKIDFDEALNDFYSTLSRLTQNVEGKLDIYRVPKYWEIDSPESYGKARIEIYDKQDTYYKAYIKLIEGCRRKLGV
ncbi:hypothetical protein [Roseivirga pacifica]|uniref:hypothetical protein n=1 Tax=Roseivirga pacifica TaxID=1267423 RepID=UPI00227A0D71|nr:hypothetical protein [Roseivirga pacifica]